jgi:isocitrate dehydrogenase kinase/phosphatase
MADTLEYSQVALPRDRFDPALLDEMGRLVPSLVEHDGDRIVLQHLYIERRLTPLDVYLKDADEARLRHGIREYGAALRELAQANIFPGDLLLKNFGVTRYGRVVFYDYDEICYLTDCHFRRIPEPPTLEDELRAEPWFSVRENDIFPEEFPHFVFPDGRPRELFEEHHGDLGDAAVWIEMQRRIRAGEQEDLFPYPEELRFKNLFE